MKHIFSILFFFLLFGKTQAQQLTFSSDALIPAYQLDITWSKTTLLIFPAAISSADRGDDYVLAERVKGVENVLRVKAGQKNFQPSNLQVITSDGKVYSFNVAYSDRPSALTIDLRKQKVTAPVAFKGSILNPRQVEGYAILLSSYKPFLRVGRAFKDGLGFGLDGIYIKDDLLFICLHLKNATQIRFEALSLRFYIHDKKKAKRTAQQDSEKTPVAIHYYGTPEESGGQKIIAVFDKFTIADKKYFQAELMENNGDRNPSLRLDQKIILKARQIMQ